MTVKLFTATKAFVRYQDKILVLRESGSYQDGAHAGRYDVPGGRITPGEHFIDALKREVLEECGLTISSAKVFFVNEGRVNKHNEEWQIIRMYFACDTDSDQVVLGTDHDAYEWIEPQHYKTVALIENLNEVFEAYLQTKNGI